MFKKIWWVVLPLHAEKKIITVIPKILAVKIHVFFLFLLRLFIVEDVIFSPRISKQYFTISEEPHDFANGCLIY